MMFAFHTPLQYQVGSCYPHMVMGLLKMRKLSHRAMKHLLRSDHKGTLGRGGGQAGEGLERQRACDFL